LLKVVLIWLFSISLILIADARVGPNSIVHANFIKPDLSSCNFSYPTSGFGNIWYFDPVNGNTITGYTTAGVSADPTVTPHQGDSTHPFKDISAIFVTVSGYTRPMWAANSGGTSASPIKSGDEILLQNGTAAQYGSLNGGTFGFTANAGGAYLVFGPAPGATPVLKSISMENIQNIAVHNITVEFAAGGGSLVTATENVGILKNVVYDNLIIEAAPYATQQTWTTHTTWLANANQSGVTINQSSCLAVINSHISSVFNGITMNGQNDHTLIENNEIDHFGEDALDWGGQSVVIRFNHCHDPVASGNVAIHQDCMQGFVQSVNRDIWLDSNLIIFQEDANLLFNDGTITLNSAIAVTNSQWFRVNVTNNRIYWLNIAGIGLGGCDSCLAANNTLAGAAQIRILIFNTGAGSVHNGNIRVVNNIVGNNMACTDPPNIQMYNNLSIGGGLNLICYNGVQINATTGGTTYAGNNTVLTSGTSLSTVLTTYIPGTPYTTSGVPTIDWSLKSGSVAIGAGTTKLPRPLIDYAGTPTNNPPDLGAVAF
jgi:hypothetical protein